MQYSKNGKLRTFNETSATRECRCHFPRHSIRWTEICQSYSNLHIKSSPNDSIPLYCFLLLALARGEYPEALYTWFRRNKSYLHRICYNVLASPCPYAHSRCNLKSMAHFERNVRTETLFVQVDLEVTKTHNGFYIG